MTTKTDWHRFRVETVSTPTFLKRNLIHWELLNAVRVRAAKRVLEVGVGSGAQIALISQATSFAVTVDNDWRILTAAQPNLQRFGARVRSVAGDAFLLPFADNSFDVAVSQGLLEHFSDDEIQDLVREQLRVGRSVVFSVPSDRYPRQDVGNERLMSPARWQEIISAGVDPGRHRVEARYYRGDLESLKYSLLAGRWLGPFSVLVTIDPRDGG